MGIRTLIMVASVWLAVIHGLGIDCSAAQATAQTPAIAQAYRLDAIFDPDASTITGKMTVTWTNTTGEPQDTLPFRLYPNADYYDEAGIELSEVSVDREAMVIEGDPDDPTHALVPLNGVAMPGDTRVIEIVFCTTIAIDSDGSFGIFRGNSVDGTWTLVNWYPIVAGWEPGIGWYLDTPPVTVDPTFVTVSAWDVTISHPADLTIVATGETHNEIANGVAITSIKLEVGRELAMVALPADEIVVEEGTAGETAVRVTLTDADAIPVMHAAILGMAHEAVERFTEWLGAPPVGELDFVSTNLDGVLGVSWTGAIWLDLAQLTADGELNDAERESLRFVVLHEIAHQWVANVIGTNSNDHTWLTEGLANVLAVAIVRDVDGPAAAERAFRGGVAGPYRAFVNGGQDAAADTPIGMLDPVVHSIVTYGKAGIGFEAIRQAIGDEAFFAALSTLARERAWEIVAPDDVLAAFEVASGKHLGELWAFWFLQADTSLADVDAVIVGSGS